MVKDTILIVKKVKLQVENNFKDDFEGQVGNQGFFSQCVKLNDGFFKCLKVNQNNNTENFSILESVEGTVDYLKKQIRNTVIAKPTRKVLIGSQWSTESPAHRRTTFQLVSSPPAGLQVNSLSTTTGFYVGTFRFVTFEEDDLLLECELVESWFDGAMRT
ncbi:hypothetical protein F2Q69_00014596 [Brassica cretica]|uniref:Uncharacterized protein n=1 Tax=Brassica cretica TaxID=69181 RepID=A0A8S9QVG5_BRACR|nr:hypothetical protein F2Q69_00014596 [Brassica cretica]